MNRRDLKNYRLNKDYIDNQLKNYNERLETFGISSQRIDSIPKATNTISYRLEEFLDEYEKMIINIKNEQTKLNKVIEQLNLLNPIYRNILYKRYIEGKTLEQVAIEIGYSYGRTCHKNGIALNEYDKYDLDK